MIHLFHGDDNFQSRQKLFNALRPYRETKFLPAKEITSEKLVNLTGGLFSSKKKSLTIEKLFSLPKSSIEKIVSQLEKMGDDIDIFLWENKKIIPSKLSVLGKKRKVSLSQIPATIFKLLDSIGQSNPYNSLNFLKLTFKSHPPELILYLMEKRLRDLLITKIDSDKLKIPPWQKKRLMGQVQKLSLEKIKDVYLNLIEIEWKNKTGQLGNSLKNELVNLVVLLIDENY